MGALGGSSTGAGSAGAASITGERLLGYVHIIEIDASKDVCPPPKLYSTTKIKFHQMISYQSL